MIRLVLIAILLFARPVTREEDEEQGYQAAESLHVNDPHGKVATYIGKGSTRQVLVFCVHSDEKVPYYRWPTTLFLILDAPETAAEAD